MHNTFRQIEMALTRLADWCAPWFSGASQDIREEMVRKRVLVGLCFAAAMPLLLINGLFSLAEGHITEGTLTIGFCLTIATALPGLRQIARPLPLFRFILAVFALLLVQGAVVGGADGSKVMWLLVYPPIVVFLCGRREGLVWSLIVLCCTAVAYGATPEALRYGYTTGFKVRMATAFLSVTLLTYSIELVRAGARHRLEQEQAALRKKSEMLAAANAKIHRISQTDALTRCYNRGYLNQHLPREMARCRRYHRPLSIILCDLDRFKNINDQYGHQFGDAVLRQLVLHLSGELRGRVDWLARYGGEEFVVVLPETAEPAACQIAERLRRVLAEDTLSADGTTVRITASFGVAGWDPVDPDSPEDVDALLGAADNRLYQAKRTGRNRVVGTEPAAAAHDNRFTVIRPDSIRDKG